LRLGDYGRIWRLRRQVILQPRHFVTVGGQRFNK
jgi:hypothetical protein